MATKNNFYGVKVPSKTPGGFDRWIVKTWSECSSLTKGVSRAQFKGFETYEAACNWIEIDPPKKDDAFEAEMAKKITNLYEAGQTRKADILKEVMEVEDDEQDYVYVESRAVVVEPPFTSDFADFVWKDVKYGKQICRMDRSAAIELCKETYMSYVAVNGKCIAKNV